jgi:hypothetical protein
MRPSVNCIVAVGLGLAVAAAAQAAPTSDPDLARGIRLVAQGEYAQAIIVLDAATQKLDRRPQDKALAAQAHLYLGIAYVGEGQETLAKASFREALTRAPNLNLRVFDVSPKVREVFQKAKDELEQQKARTADKKKGGSKLPLILLGLGGAGAAAAAATGGGGAGGSGGSVSTLEAVVQVPTPPNPALLGLEVTFTARGGNFSSYSWDFGDGSTGTGQTPRHRYMSAGTFSVSVTATGGAGMRTATTSIVVRSLTGTWDGVTLATGERFVVRLTQSGFALSGDMDGAPITGEVDQCCPSIRLSPACSVAGGTTGGFQGRATDDLNSIAGSGNYPCRASMVNQTLTRRQ